VGRRTDAIVLRGLARNPSRRYESARAMALAVEKALPLATASQVGEWVEHLVAETLAERRRQIESIEGYPEGAGGADVVSSLRLAREPDPNAIVATAPGKPRPEESLVATRREARGPLREAAGTDTSLVSSELRPRKGPSRVPLALAAAIAVLAVVGGVVVSRSRPPAAPLPGPAASAAPSPPVTATASEAPATIEVESLPQASAIPREPGAAPARTSPGQAASTHPRRAPASCNPPYTIDDNGFRKYKRECATW